MAGAIHCKAPTARSHPPGWQTIAPWARRLLAITLILLMQGPAMVLQEIAWLRMLTSYTQERGLQRGVAETFDGDHPCELCLKVKAIRQEEQRQETPDKPGDQKRRLMAWAEMLAGKNFTLPPVRGEVELRVGTGHTPTALDRTRDGPRPPPPRTA